LCCLFLYTLQSFGMPNHLLEFRYSCSRRLHRLIPVEDYSAASWVLLSESVVLNQRLDQLIPPIAESRPGTEISFCYHYDSCAQSGRSCGRSERSRCQEGETFIAAKSLLIFIRSTSLPPLLQRLEILHHRWKEF